MKIKSLFTLAPSSLFCRLSLLGILCLGAFSAAQAQDNGALLDLLVRKKVLSAQEAEDVRSELARENASTSAGKLRLGSAVNSLNLSGDMRLRYQFDEKSLVPELNKPFNNTPGTSKLGQDGRSAKRQRERLRLRVGADFQLEEGFFGGIQLQTTQAADSGNQTMASSGDSASGFGNYNIYISRAYFGWQNDVLRLVGGKQKNPFYTTDLVWDNDINPTGFAETIDLIRLFQGGGDVYEESPLDLSLVAGQLIMNDNEEYNWGKDFSTDVWLFKTQLIAAAKIVPGVKLTLAPAFMTYTSGNLSGLNNETKFNNDTSVFTGASRNLSIITAPGDVAFKLFGLKTKFLWDFAYNTQGKDRVEKVYNLDGLNGVSGHSGKDDIAWLIGLQLGENKKKGDWSVFANYRQTGIGAVDPNLNDSDFALGQLNSKGYKIGAAYNISDACSIGAAWYDSKSLRKGLVGGEATGGNKLAQYGDVRIFQLDLNLKF